MNVWHGAAFHLNEEEVPLQNNKKKWRIWCVWQFNEIVIQYSTRQTFLFVQLAQLQCVQSRPHVLGKPELTIGDHCFCLKPHCVEFEYLWLWYPSVVIYIQTRWKTAMKYCHIQILQTLALSNSAFVTENNVGKCYSMEHKLTTYKEHNERFWYY